MDYKILLLPGDGIGPEIIKEAVKVLEAVGKKYGHNFIFQESLVGGIAIDETGSPLPTETIDKIKSSDAVFLGAVGGPKWDTTDPNKPRPEQGLLGLRKTMKVFANVRPVKAHKQLLNASTLKNEVIKDVDLVFVRELTGGVYFGKQLRVANEALDTCSYNDEEIIRVVEFAVEMAKKRRGKVTSVDKANVLETSRLWRENAQPILADSGLEYEHMLVDNCAMQLIRNPSQFDVVVTENMFGDILSDEAAMLTGSIGMLSSGSFGNEKPALFEPIHGSAPDIAGKDIANPIATIQSCAMMLRLSFNLDKEADAVENAIETVLENGYRTLDIIEQRSAFSVQRSETKETQVGTTEMGELICHYLK